MKVEEIFRLLPRIDCGQCPCGSCEKFAKAVAQDCGMLPECQRLTPTGLMLIKAKLCEGQ